MTHPWDERYISLYECMVDFYSKLVGKYTVRLPKMRHGILIPSKKSWWSPIISAGTGRLCSMDSYQPTLVAVVFPNPIGSMGLEYLPTYHKFEPTM